MKIHELKRRYDRWVFLRELGFFIVFVSVFSFYGMVLAYGLFGGG